jgi:glycosyltransferase involved in cell wall biosynthesis
MANYSSQTLGGKRKRKAAPVAHSNGSGIHGGTNGSTNGGADGGSIGDPNRAQPINGAASTNGATSTDGTTTGNGHDAQPDDVAAQRRSYELTFIARNGLFDTEYYLSQYPDIAQAGIPALEHFFDFGCSEGRRPNLYFDPRWYLNQNADVQQAGSHAFSHYVFYGDIEGRRPSLLFDPSWYRKQYQLGEAENALAHYLRNRKGCRFAPIQDFDIDHYARSYPDVVAAGIDPFEHFVNYGYLEGRTPSVNFDAKFYSTRYLGGDAQQNPFLHYLAHKHEPGVFGRMPDDEPSIPREVKRFTKPGADFEEFAPLPASAPRRAKLLAYYLPQFHAFPENDAWWGKGFTEWTNVGRGIPRFSGHYQPRVPRDLGFYSLNQTETIRRQAEMAKAGGVFGFVFYYYWFNGKRLLDKPIDAFLDDQAIQMPFCLMWANENWTRRWDGADSEVLISQDYRVEDEQRLAADLARHFRDPRYIRVKGRPLLMIYRPGLINDARKTLSRWRKLFKEKFKEDPLLVMGQTFRATDPTEFGMDGAIEFPPHKLTQDLPPINKSLRYLDIEFEGKAYRYDEVVRVSLDEPKPSFPLIKTVVPGWDNDARRQGNGLVLTESTPQKYQAWLSALVDRAVDTPFFDEPIVCVNAWNEWCEAAYLEPDLHYGAAYLNATARAVVGRRQANSEGRVLLVGHDAFPSGAQHLLLNIGRTLRSHFGVETSVILLDGGKLEKDYRELGQLMVGGKSAALEAHLWSLKESGYSSAIVNTSAAASIVPALTKAGVEVTMLVHELPRLLREKKLVPDARAAALRASNIVFPAAFVRDQFCGELELQRVNDMLVLPQGMYQDIALSPSDGAQLRRELGVRKGQRLVISIGYADLRKGFDLFLQLWRLVRTTSSVVTHFCWVGNIDPMLKDWMRNEIADAEHAGTFHMVGYREQVSAYLSAADAFVLTSREDPFPSVVLEALYAGLPTVAFDNSGGIPDLLRSHLLGQVVPFADTVAMAAAVESMLRKGASEPARIASRKVIREKFDFPAYVWQLLRLVHRELPAISVAVPNYNYARHMPKRLSSVFLQTQPVKEILVLDDCSTDDSLKAIPAVAAEWGRHIRLIANRSNSGSVFRQWRKAAQMATGEFLWIAEADDYCAPGFLTEVVSMMRHDPSVQFAFCDSSAVDSDDQPLSASYKSYYATVAADALARTQVFDGAEFVRRFLSVKNLILNVSAVLWRRDALLSAMDACETDLYNYRMAGDWRLYLQALCLQDARVAYCAEPLNTHRRHARSVTHAMDVRKHVSEIDACHAFVASQFHLQPQIKKAQAAYLAEVQKQLGAKPVNVHKHRGADRTRLPSKNQSRRLRG